MRCAAPRTGNTTLGDFKKLQQPVSFMVLKILVSSKTKPDFINYIENISSDILWRSENGQSRFDDSSQCKWANTITVFNQNLDKTIDYWIFHMGSSDQSNFFLLLHFESFCTSVVVAIVCYFAHHLVRLPRVSLMFCHTNKPFSLLPYNVLMFIIKKVRPLLGVPFLTVVSRHFYFSQVWCRGLVTPHLSPPRPSTSQ